MKSDQKASEVVSAEEMDTQKATRADLEAEQKRLDRLEDLREPGARSMTPKQEMLDLREMQKKYPDRHFRWLNTAVKENMETRRMEGYTLVPEDEGGRRLGTELALAWIPKERAEARVARQEREHNRRLKSFHEEMAKAVEQVERDMRDRYGVDRKLFIRDE